MIVLRFFRRLVLRWSREHSHVLLACGYGVYLPAAQTFRFFAVAALTRACQIGASPSTLPTHE